MLIDVFQRYLAIYDLVLSESINSGGSELTLLDVGSNGAGFAEYNHFENVRQTNIDIVETSPEIKNRFPKINFQTYPGTKLPFDDDAFDFVICVDVLEHVPPSFREQFILEVVRVSKAFVAFSFPIKTSEPWEKILWLITSGRIRFLREHINNGLPDEEDFLGVVSSTKNIQLKHISGNLSIWLWIPLKLISSISRRLFTANGLMKNFLFYREHVSKYLNWGQCYSKSFILQKKAADP